MPILLIGAFAFFVLNTKEAEIKNFDRFAEINFEGTILKAEVVDSGSQRSLGLSDRTSLAQNEAMLFVFETPGKHGFWMKDMLFPIDIFWLNSKKEIVHIEKDLSPNTYPKVYYPGSDASYVLETNSGITDKLKIKIGDKFKF
jgi:hypothetical protein